MKVLDVGCGAGHYLITLRKELDKNIDYTGIDITEYYIKLAKKAYPGVPFYICDIHELGWDADSFDIIICNNVILHLPPDTAEQAIKELLRVTSDYVIIRTPVGISDYIIKEKKDKDKWNYLNLYTVETMKEMIGSVCSIDIVSDVYWDDLQDIIDRRTSTRIIDDRQVSGNIILDWKFFIIRE
jgi:ubiquinone/menaquinone biosynthesis C-methylase UbiE